MQHILFNARLLHGKNRQSSMSSVDNKNQREFKREFRRVLQVATALAPSGTLQHSVRKKNSLNSVPSVDNKINQREFKREFRRVFLQVAIALADHPKCYDTL